MRFGVIKANSLLNTEFGNPANNGRLRIYSGTQPTLGGGSITSQVLLAEFVLPVNAFDVSAGILTANDFGTTLGLAAGIATWFRLLEDDLSTVIMDGTVGEAGSESDLTIDDVNIGVDEIISVSSLTIEWPLNQ